MKPRASTTSAQVARAITHLVRDDLPTAITSDVIADTIASLLIDDMGLPSAPPQMKRAFIDVARQELEDGQLRAGCQLYSQQTGRPHVPVTRYFFTNVYCEEDRSLAECIERGAITKTEVYSSLPRRSSYAKRHDGTLDRDEVIDNSTAGFVIFAPMSESPLLLEWMNRLRSNGIKTVNTTMTNVAKAVDPSRLPSVAGAVAVLEQLVPSPGQSDFRG